MKRDYDFTHAKRGPVTRVPKGKTRITIRLDEDLLDWFRQQVDRAGGGGYQSLINDALRQHVRRAQEPSGGYASPRYPRGAQPRQLRKERIPLPDPLLGAVAGGDYHLQHSCS